MRDLLDTFDDWRAAGVEAGRAVVVRTFGSAPRPEGAVLLRAADGRIAGSVSGGCIEGAAAEEIERARETGRSRVIRYGISDEQAWGVGLACGGTIDVLIEPVVAARVVAAARASIQRDEAGSVVITALPPDSPPPTLGAHASGEGDPPGEPLVVGADGAISGTTADGALDSALAGAARDALDQGTSRTVEASGRSFFLEAFPARPRLVIVGAVEVARALAGLAHGLGYETIIIDGRPAFATEERFPDVDRLVLGWPDEVADEIGLGPRDAVAVLSHDPKFDEPAIVTGLRRGCRYVGAVGSRKTQAARRSRLQAAGLSDAELARLHGPIGLDLGGRAPAEMALAIMAEIIAARYGGSGRPMIERGIGAPGDRRPFEIEVQPESDRLEVADRPTEPERVAGRSR